jgi:GNAT superfamily N-acetyltransferase
MSSQSRLCLCISSVRASCRRTSSSSSASQLVLTHNSGVAASARPTTNAVILPLRNRSREEMACQIVHDSIHRRVGWTTTFALSIDESVTGFGSIAVGGPWAGKPTIFEFYVLPAHRDRAFDLFEALAEASGARHMEIQSNDLLATAMLHTYARGITSESIVFRDGVTTAWASNGATLRQISSDEEVRAAIKERQGGPEWHLHLDGAVVASGGILFHYNEPYGDVYMEVTEPFRRRNLGTYMVQELKRRAYELGSIPGARCSPTNVASRRTLQKAGFEPYAHILAGSIPS